MQEGMNSQSSVWLLFSLIDSSIRTTFFYSEGHTRPSRWQNHTIFTTIFFNILTALLFFCKYVRPSALCLMPQLSNKKYFVRMGEFRLFCSLYNKLMRFLDLWMQWTGSWLVIWSGQIQAIYTMDGRSTTGESVHLSGQMLSNLSWKLTTSVWFAEPTRCPTKATAISLIKK